MLEEIEFYHDFKGMQVNFNHPPKNMNLILFGNYYEIKFMKPALIDKYDILKTKKFNEMKITNTNIAS